MAEKSSFFNSVSGDRKYSAEDWAAYFASFVSNGVYAKPSNGLQVVISSGMGITIKAGSAFINGYFYRNTTDLGKTLSVADGVLNRIDRVVLRWSLLNRTMSVEVLEGASASSPTATALTRNAETYEMALGDVYIGKGAASISQSNITDCRYDSNLCGIVTGLIDQFDFTAFCTKFDAFYSDYIVEANSLLEELRNQISQAASQTLIDKSVTFPKLANDAIKRVVTNKEVAVSSFVSDTTYADYPYRAAVAVNGVTTDMIPEIIFDVADAIGGNYSPVAQTYDGGVYIYAASPPDSNLTIPTIIVWREGVGTW